MQQQQAAAQAYRKTAQATVAPRELEANLLSMSAGHFQRIRNDWDLLGKELTTALTFNRKLWSVFLTSVTEEECPLPQELRQSMANLGVFVMCHTMELQVEPKPEKLDVLININRQIAAGLRSSPQD